MSYFKNLLRLRTTYDISDACATVYDGTNQSGSSADLPVGKFNAYFPGINPYNQMPLGDRTESVSVTEGRGFSYWTYLIYNQ